MAVRHKGKKQLHDPEPTPDTTWTVWIRSESSGGIIDFRGVVDAITMPNGVVNVFHHDGVRDELAGTILRVKQDE